MAERVTEETALIYESPICDCMEIMVRGRFVLVTCHDHANDWAWYSTVREAGIAALRAYQRQKSGLHEAGGTKG